MSDYNMNQPSPQEIREKIRIAREARELGARLRAGKRASFRPQVGRPMPTYRPPVMPGPPMPDPSRWRNGR